MDRPALPRSISSADLACTNRCITYIQRDRSQDNPRGTVNYFNITPSFTLTVPSLHNYPREFRDYVFRRLIDYRVKEELESAKIINWCREASTFVPLSTIGDGNCLLHAASLGMWGFQDRKFILRQAVHAAIGAAKGTSLYPRWMNWHKKEMEAIGVKLERDQWSREWRIVMDNVSMEKTREGVLQGLDQFHIFVLANVLCRPIIMYSLPKIRSAREGVTLQNLNYQGLYLPLLWDPMECKKIPLPIAFSGGHFTSLVAIDLPQQYKNGRLLLPLADYTGSEFPVMFQLPEEAQDVRRAYLNIVNVQGSGYAGIPCAEMFLNEVPAYLKPLLSGFIDKCFDAFRYDQSQTLLNQAPQSSSNSPKSESRPPCKSSCGFSGDPMYDGYCSKCYKIRLQSRQSFEDTTRRGSGSGSSSLRCCNGCDKPGLPDRLGMCWECFNAKKTSGGGARGVDSSSLSSSNQTAPVSEIKPCRSPGCEFSGTKERQFYCSQCYKTKMPRSYGEHSDKRMVQTLHQEMVTGREEQYDEGRRDPLNGAVNNLGDPGKCLNCWEYHGSPEYGGLCHDCFLKKTAAPAEPHPDKCRSCKEYFGCPEFGGFCNNCFMKKTEVEAKGKPFETHPCDNIDHPLAAGRQGEESRDNYLHNPLGHHDNPPLGNPPFSGQEARQTYGSTRDHFAGMEQPHVPPMDPPATGLHGNYPPSDHSQPGAFRNVPPSDPPVGGQFGNYHGPDPPPVGSPASRKMSNSSAVEHHIYDKLDFRGQQQHLSCFLCSEEKPTMLLNVVCQKHAMDMWKMFVEESKRGMSVPTGASKVGGATGFGVEPTYGNRQNDGQMNGRDEVGGASGFGWEQGVKPKSQEHRAYTRATDVESEARTPVKTLCRTAGCSYYQIKEYGGYCKNCCVDSRRSSKQY